MYTDECPLCEEWFPRKKLKTHMKLCIRIPEDDLVHSCPRGDKIENENYLPMDNILIEREYTDDNIGSHISVDSSESNYVDNHIWDQKSNSGDNERILHRGRYFLKNSREKIKKIYK